MLRPADEDIQSSKSGIHFGHYKAAAYNEYLTSLLEAKLNLILSTGIPLERWTHGLTVLLEKEFGSVYIDKLRAICLFEADYNCLQKPSHLQTDDQLSNQEGPYPKGTVRVQAQDSLRWYHVQDSPQSHPSHASPSFCRRK